MISIHKHYYLPRLEKKWLLLSNSTSQSPFQSYDVVKHLWYNFYPYCITKRIVPLFYEVLEDQKTKLIAPICVNINGSYVLFGDINGGEYCDFIYSKDEDITKYFNALVKKLNYNITFNLIKEESPLFQILSNDEHFEEVKKHKYVNIPFDKDHSLYFKSLSASMRQNIRTAYNRIAREKQSLKFFFLDQDRLTTADLLQNSNLSLDISTYQDSIINCKERERLFYEMVNVYIKRHEIKSDVHTSKLKEFYYHHINFSTKSFKKSRLSRSILLFINDRLAAFMSGYVSSDGNTFVVPRLAIDNDYFFYSPGVILINETIKYLSLKTDVVNLDLAMGTEQYKYKMGGVEHYTYLFKPRKR